MKTVLLLALGILGGAGLSRCQTSPFPTSADSLATLGVPADNTSTALTAGMLIGAAAATVANGALIPQWALITFGAELDQVCLVSGNTISFGTPTTCPSISGRGLSGTTVAAHALGVIGYLNTNGYYHQAVSAAVIAIENAWLGTGVLANYTGTVTHNDMGDTTAGAATIDMQNSFAPSAPSALGIAALEANGYWRGAANSPLGAITGGENQATAQLGTGGFLGYVIGTNSIALLEDVSSGVYGNVGLAQAVAGLVQDISGTITLADVFSATGNATNTPASIITNLINFHSYGCGVNSGATIGTCTGLYVQGGAGTANVAVQTEAAAGPLLFGGQVIPTPGTTCATPSIGELGHLNYGLDYETGLVLCTAGVDSLHINSSHLAWFSGSLGIGVSVAPRAKVDIAGGNLILDGTPTTGGEVIVSLTNGSTTTGVAISSSSIGTIGSAAFSIDYAGTPVLTVGSNTVAYAPSGWSVAGDVVCFKAGGVLGHATVTTGAVGSCS